MLLPAGSQIYSMSENKVVVMLTGHTVEKPRLLILSRTPRNSAGNFSYNVKVVRGVTQTDGSIRNRIIECIFRNVPAQTTADATDPTNILKTLMGTEGFASDSGITLLLPDFNDIMP